VEELTENEKYRYEYWLQFIIHRFGIAYGWTKTQIDEVYPDEAVVLLKMIALDSADEGAKTRIEKYEEYLQLIKIHHSDNVKSVFNEYLRDVEKILNSLKSPVAGVQKDLTNELPDLNRMRALKNFVKNPTKAP